MRLVQPWTADQFCNSCKGCWNMHVFPNKALRAEFHSLLNPSKVNEFTETFIVSGFVLKPYR